MAREAEFSSSGLSLLRRIDRVIADLPTSERRIAETIRQTPADMAVWTAMELAVKAQVSNASVSRFVRRLGYGSFEEARQAARKLRDNGSPVFMRNDDGVVGARFARLIAQEHHLIVASVAMLEPQLGVLAAVLAQARRIRVLGYRNSRFLADYLRAQMAQLRSEVGLLLTEGQGSAEALAELGAGDVVVVVALRRRPTPLLPICAQIKATGARLLLISDQSLPSSAIAADWRIDCAIETAWRQDSYVGVLAVLRLIGLELGQMLGEAGLAHLNRIELLREELGELSQNEGRLNG